MKKAYIKPVNQRIRALSVICSRYSLIVCRDVHKYWPGSAPLRDIKDQFQIGYLPTLRYISFNRIECEPLAEWVEGFIEAARKRETFYKKYPFYE